MSDITITLNLTKDELIRLQALTLMDAVNTGGKGDLNNKVARAIERAESFVVTADDMRNGLDIDGNKPVDCAGCEGSGMETITTHNSKRNCYYCSGTGKEYI